MMTQDPSEMKCVTLAHKGAMPIAVHAVESFSRLHPSGHHLEIHSDGSLDDGDRATLSRAAGSLPHSFVGPDDRLPLLKEKLRDYPRIRALASLGGYFTKLQLPMVVPKPYFYFDSDIVWLRQARGLRPDRGGDVFSTETWTWYYGARNDREWIRQRVPRRVNSGFYHLESDFPFDRMEEMLERGLFDHTTDYNTDQEIMAFLFRDMAHYHIDDFKRSRVGVRYDLKAETGIALHFPGGMWKDHLDQIANLADNPAPPPMTVRISPATALGTFEMLRMRFYLRASRMELFKYPIRLYRHLRSTLRRGARHSG